MWKPELQNSCTLRYTDSWQRSISWAFLRTHLWFRIAIYSSQIFLSVTDPEYTMVCNLGQFRSHRIRRRLDRLSIRWIAASDNSSGK